MLVALRDEEPPGNGEHAGPPGHAGPCWAAPRLAALRGEGPRGNRKHAAPHGHAAPCLSGSQIYFAARLWLANRKSAACFCPRLVIAVPVHYCVIPAKPAGGRH